MSPPAPPLPHAVILSFVEWAGAFQRPQHLALGLARHGWRVSYVSPGYLHRRGQRVSSGIELPPHLEIIEPPALPGVSRMALIEHLNAALARITLRRMIKAGTPLDLVIFNDARWAPAAQSLPARLRVFDCMDDLGAQVPDEQRLRTLEQYALTVADRIWTGTGQLEERLRPEARALGKPLRFVACGVDAEHFGRPGPRKAEWDDLVPPGKGPLAGYFGVVNERIEPALLEGLLDAGWRILLIGPGTSRAPALPSDPRLRWIGPRPYAELPGWLRRFDLALIPYDYRGPHRFLYPVKALEYLAGGKPVLSTPLPDVVRFLKNYVALADTRLGWQQAGERLMHEPGWLDAATEAGRQYARSRNWDAMVSEMLSDAAAESA